MTRSLFPALAISLMGLAVGCGGEPAPSPHFVPGSAVERPKPAQPPVDTPPLTKIEMH